jgi:hypothetical protein
MKDGIRIVFSFAAPLLFWAVVVVGVCAFGNCANNKPITQGNGLDFQGIMVDTIPTPKEKTHE